MPKAIECDHRRTKDKNTNVDFAVYPMTDKHPGNWRWREMEVAFLGTNRGSIVITNVRQPPTLGPALHSIQLDKCWPYQDTGQMKDRTETFPHPMSHPFILTT